MCRASDLVFHLISPQGTRILLAENRGHDSTAGYGLDATIKSNNFQHVAVTFDRVTGLCRLYYNGGIAAEKNFGPITPVTPYDLYLGYRAAGPGAGTHFRGAMDDVGLFNRALSPLEVQAIYNAGTVGGGKTGSIPGLTSLWRLDGSAADAVGPNTGQLFGNPAFSAGKVGLALVFDGLDD